MGALELIGLTLGIAIGFMTVIWIFSLILRNASIVDIFWGPGFITLACAVFAVARGSSARSLLMLVLVLAWGVRLALHVGIRNAGRGEDWRYRKWRDEAGPAFWWRSYFKVFLLQGTILAVVALPLTLGISAVGPARIGGLGIAGLGVWLLGFAFETIGDAQLSRFKRDPANAGKVMDRGLWRYTRHPNYFGESLVWWGIFLIAAATPLGAWSVFGPVLITFLLVRVSGVRMLEAGLKERKPEYADYIRRTSAFIPWPPRRS
ncbi:DUF1295 domain-containing protein [Candidatus Bipolaricaulota bacterium]|nr:DUF1295 domain-containing protein [Candidatus Bipolaricaulota bacterium]